MIHILNILKSLGPGYWLESRYIAEGLEVDLFFRDRDKDLLIKQTERFTPEYIRHKAAYIELDLQNMKEKIQGVVKAKLKTKE